MSTWFSRTEKVPAAISMFMNGVIRVTARLLRLVPIIATRQSRVKANVLPLLRLSFFLSFFSA